MTPFHIELKGKQESKPDVKPAVAAKRDDAKDFSKILDDKMKPNEKENSNDKREIGQREEEAKPAVAAKTKEAEREFSPLQHFLYELSTRDPQTWSIAERQQYHVEQTRVNLQELRRLLSERNLKLSDLSAEQLKRASTLPGNRQMSDFLDRISRDVMAAEEQGALAQSPFARFRTSLSEIERREGVKESEIVKQVVDQIRLRNLANGSQIDLVLKPEALGEVKLRLVVEGKQVTATFETANRRVSRVLSAGLPELGRALSEQGLEVKSLDVQRIS